MNNPIIANVRRVGARPISGWALDAIIELSASFPDLLRLSLAGGDLRRQAIFTTLAFDVDIGRPVTLERFGVADDCELARALVRCRARDIIDAVVQPKALGMFGSVSRLGGDPVARELYISLAEVLRAAGPTADAILEMSGQLHPGMIAAAPVLDPVAAMPSVLALVSSRVEAEVVNSYIAIVRDRTGATDEEIRASLLASMQPLDIRKWCSRWLLNRMRDLPCEVPTGDGFRVLPTGTEIEGLGRRARNCIASRIRHVAAGMLAYLTNPEETVIAEIRRVTAAGGDRWHTTEIVGVSNRRPPKDDLDEFVRCLRAAGILTTAAPVSVARVALTTHEWFDYYPHGLDDFGDLEDAA